MNLRDIIGTEQSNEMYELFMEYEKAETKEAKLVKDLDKLDMLIQAFEYLFFTNLSFLVENFNQGSFC
jgi:5'-deoxynucleotidase YfbR-like HD superfamily hydrolase